MLLASLKPCWRRICANCIDRPPLLQKTTTLSAACCFSQNLAAAALELSPADLEKVGGFVSSHKVSGPRYNPADLAAIDR